MMISPRVSDGSVPAPVSGEMSVPGQPAINHIVGERLPPVGQATARVVSGLGQNIIIEYKQDQSLPWDNWGRSSSNTESGLCSSGQGLRHRNTCKIGN